MNDDAEVFGHFGSTVGRDFFRMVTERVIGVGAFRVVYEHAHRPDLVLKFETGAENFQNIMEWEFWDDHKDDKKVAAWLAPCEFISPCGTVLAMKKTVTPLLSEYPKTVPAFLTDLKRKNFGMLNGKLVAHDYGWCRLKPSTRRRKADWWGDSPLPR